MIDFKKMAANLREEQQEPPHLESEEQKESKSAYGMMIAVLILPLFLLLAMPVHAAGGDPLGTINNLSSFIFSAIRAIGLILLGFGVVQIGMSLKSHDASQRANGFLTFFGGLLIAFAKNILDLILA